MKKILLITNNALVDGDANGRTLGNILKKYPKECLIQFCTNGHSVSSKYVVNAYKFSDRDVIQNIFKIRCKCKKLAVDSNEVKRVSTEVSVKKSSAIICAREILWRIALPRLDLEQRIQEFEPDVICLQLGACAFTAILAYKLAKKFNARLIVFTTEDYYFKTWNYIEKGKKSIWYDAFSRYYNKMVEKLFEKADYCICNTPFLSEMYNQKFGVKTSVIMNAANMTEYDRCEKDRNKIVYAGNLELERYVSLGEIAQEVFRVSPEYHLDVYGQFSKEIINELKKHPNIRLKGLASYDSVLREMSSATLVLHMESQNSFYKKDLRAAFSTKIPDSLSCGVPFLLYAPEELAETKYLQENNCAFVCTSFENLSLIIKQSLTDHEQRELILRNAKDIVEKNHTHRVNQKKFIDILEC